MQQLKTSDRIVLVIVLLLAAVGCDQLTKASAREHLRNQPTHTFFFDTARLTYAENSGAFLTLGESLPKVVRTLLFKGFVSLLVVGLLAAALYWPRLARAQVIAVTLLGASGLGNLIDRLFYDGKVTDFINVGIGSLRTGIFNLADMYGVAACIILLLVGTATDARHREPNPAQGTSA